MKRIALLTDGWKRFMTYAWNAGALQYIKETGMDAGIAQYLCWGNFSHDPDFNLGEYQIFHLPDLSAFDGILVDLTNIRNQEVKKDLIQRIVDSGVPAVSLCYAADGLYYAGVDGRSTISAMVEHLYEKHGCRSFCFAGGPKDNYENEERADAFRQAMVRLGLAEYRDAVSYGDFEPATGKKAAEALLAGTKPLPDAVVCANDNIALGLIAELQAHGVRVPEDVKVTGFDNLDKAAYFDPQITTAGLAREKIAYLAMQVLDDIFHGRKVCRYNYVKPDILWTESCGCENPGTVSYREYVTNEVRSIVTSNDREDRLSACTGEFIAAGSIEELSEKVVDALWSFEDLDGAAVLFDENYLGMQEDYRLPDVWKHPDHYEVKAMRFRKEMPRLQSGRDLHASASSLPPGTMCTIVPLHVGAAPIGLVFLLNPAFLADHWDIFSLHEALLRVLENRYQKRCLQNAIDRLEQIYDHDTLTGVFSRTAVDRKLVPAFLQLISENGGGRCAVIFTDIDHFKSINDLQGHASGDRVLQSAAGVLAKNLPEGGYICRYGGDEFVVLFPVREEKEAQAYVRRIQEELKEDGIGISCGISIAPDSTCGNGSLYDYVKAADHSMYQMKEAHHREEE